MEPEATVQVANNNFGKELLFATVIIIVALGAGFMIYKKSSQNTQPPINSISSDPVVQKISTQSSSDEIDSIEADVNATDFSNIGN